MGGRRGRMGGGRGEEEEEEERRQRCDTGVPQGAV